MDPARLQRYHSLLLKKHNDLWLPNCYFSQDSSGFSVLLRVVKSLERCGIFDDGCGVVDKSKSDRT